MLLELQKWPLGVTAKKLTIPAAWDLPFPFFGFGPHLGVLRAYPDSELRSHKEATMCAQGEDLTEVGHRPRAIALLGCAISEACISLPF